MKMSVITINYDDEKLSALRRYMRRKDVVLENEITAQLDKLYAKYVPSDVQEYIEERKNEPTNTTLKRRKSTEVTENGMT